MNEHELQKALSAHIDGELTPEQAEDLEKHFKVHPAARKRLKELKQMVGQVRDLPRIKPPADFPAQVMAGVTQVSAARGARAMRPPRRKRSAEDPFAEDPFEDEPFLDEAPPEAFGPDPMCAPYGELLSASLDDELTDGERLQLRDHLRDCANCRAEQRILYHVMDRVQAMPRMVVPYGFLTKISKRIDEEDLVVTRAALQERQGRVILFSKLGRLAQAACFLFVLAGGIMLTTPKEQRLTNLSTASPRKNRAHRHDHQPNVEIKTRKTGRPTTLSKDAADAPKQKGRSTLSGQFDAEWRLQVTTPLPQARRTVGNLLQQRGGHIQSEASGLHEHALAVSIAANSVDDLHDDLTTISGILTNAESEESLLRIHTEQDQVVLKNGYVLVGQTRAKGNLVVVSQNGVTYRIKAREDMEYIDPASKLRRVKIVLLKRD